MSAQYFIAQTVQDNQYVVLLASKVMAGPFGGVAEAVKAQEGLVRAEPAPQAAGSWNYHRTDSSQ